MMKKIILILSLFVLLTGTAFAGSTTGNILSFEMGIVNGFNLDTNNLGTGTSFAFNMPLTSKLEVGFQMIDGDGTNLRILKLLKFSVYMSSKMGFSILTGADNGNRLAAGAGFFVDLYKRGKSLQTALQMQINYIYVDAVNETGTLTFGLAAKFGI